MKSSVFSFIPRSDFDLLINFVLDTIQSNRCLFYNVSRRTSDKRNTHTRAKKRLIALIVLLLRASTQLRYENVLRF